MPKPRKYELFRCMHFAWRLSRRVDVWYADGRTNRLNAGRHSLGTRDKEEALRRLAELDIQRAADLGLIPRAVAPKDSAALLSLDEGRQLYEQHNDRPGVTGGVVESTKKSYRKVFDKFIPFAKSRGIETWNLVDEEVLIAYAKKLETSTKHRRDRCYATKTILNELTTIKQTIKWLIDAAHLVGKQKMVLPLKKIESERAYCYRPTEVAAMVGLAGSKSAWIGWQT